MSEVDECVTCGQHNYNSVNAHYYNYPSHKPEDWEECPRCGERYDGLGYHWRFYPEHRPQMTKHQKEIVTGILMGDASIDRENTPRLSFANIDKEYAEYIDNQLGIFSTGLNIQKETNAGNKLYVLKTRSLPELQEYADWYSTGKKVFPDDIILTPTTLTHWYMCDGSRKTACGTDYIKIAMSNEVGNSEKIDRYFERENLPKPNWIRADTEKGIIFEAYWDSKKTRELFEYMDTEIDGYDYKFPEAK
jgi:hypothetical protein